MKSSYINFVLTGDNNYVAPLGVCMTSILLNLAENRQARFFVFVQGFTKDDKKRLEDVKKVRPCEIIFVEMEDYIHLFDCIDTSKFVLQYVNLVVYYRLLMLDILPEDVDKCFYIDGDMIIDSDLSYLYDKFDEENVMGAVVEILAMQYRDSILKHFMEWKDLKNFQNNPLKYPYFNAGFFLLNVKKAKELELFKKAFEFLDNHPNPPYADQDTLNYIVGQTHPHLLEHFPPSYNVFCDMHHDIDLYYDAFYDKKDIQEAFNHPRIYHYGGANKPWINRKVRFFYLIWWRYCRLSPWSDLPEPEPEEINLEELTNTTSNINNSDKYKNFNNPRDTCSTFKLFNFIPLFKKKIKYNEKKYYILGIRFYSKKQVTSYFKYYRFLGLKFKKINLQKMFEFQIENVKNVMSCHFQDSKNRADWLFDKLMNHVDCQLQGLRNDINLAINNSDNLTNTMDDKYNQLLNSKLEDIKNDINHINNKFISLKDEFDLISKNSLENFALLNKNLEIEIDKLSTNNLDTKQSLNVRMQGLNKK